MGKVRRRRSKTLRYNPISASSPNKTEEHDEELEFAINGNEKNSDTGGIKSILSKISSSVIEEKITALRTLTSLTSDISISEYLIQEQCISTITALFSHEDRKLKLASSGALRNLCISASDNVLEGMVSQDIMNPLVNLLRECSNSIDSKEDAINKRSLSEVTMPSDDSAPWDFIFNHAVHILWSLCEGNEEALKTFNQEGLISILLKHINPKIWGYSLSLPIAECLLCVTDNNESVTSAILPTADSFISALHNTNCEQDAQWIHYSVILSGILLNLNYCTPGEGNLKVILDSLSKSLETDNSFYVDLVTNNKLQTGQSNGHSISLQDLEFILSSQLLSLELLSNFFCPGDDEEDYEDISDEEADQNEAMDVCVNAESDTLPTEVIEAIKYYKFLEKIQKRIQMPLDTLSNVEYKKIRQESVIEKFYQIRIRALQCFQNLVSCLDIEELGGSKLLFDMWIEFGQWLCSSKKSDASLQEAVSGAMRVIIDKLRTGECQQLLEVTSEEIKQIFEAGSMCSLGLVRANLVRMVGNLGCFLIEKSKEKDVAQRPLSQVLSSSTDYLLKVASEDCELFVSAEALDVIIDIFSDDKTDKLAAEIHLVDRLNVVQPQFKYQKMKNKLGDHKPLVLTVRDNLSSFIKYKSSRVSKHLH